MDEYQENKDRKVDGISTARNARENSATSDKNSKTSNENNGISIEDNVKSTENSENLCETNVTATEDIETATNMSETENDKILCESNATATDNNETSTNLTMTLKENHGSSTDTKVTAKENIKTASNSNGKENNGNNISTNVATAENIETASNTSDTDSVVNIYEDIEPDEIIDVDFVSGKHLLPYNEKLLEKINEFERYGMFSSFQTEKIKTKVDEMKAHFLNGIKSTEYEAYFSSEDDWIAKGSSAEGSFYPCIFGLDEKGFKNIVLGENPDQTAVEGLNSFIEQHVDNNKTAWFDQMVPDIDIMVSPKHLRFSSEDVLRPTKHTGYFKIMITSEDIGPWKSCLESTSEPQVNSGIENTYNQTQNGSKHIQGTANTNTTANTNFQGLSPTKVKEAFHKSLWAMSEKYSEENATMIVVPHGLAYQVSVISAKNNIFAARQYDFALGVECHFWPSCAKEWITRKRTWPEEADVKRIADDGVNLMIKSPTGSLATNLLWRVSFARAEYSISRLPIVYWYTKRSWSQVKDFLQRFSVEYKPKLLNSYHIKTLYLYSLERLPRDYWINGENTLKTILALIDELIICLSIHECKHYFMHQVNLLKSTSNPIDPDFFPVAAKNLLKVRCEIMDDPARFFFGD